MRILLALAAFFIAPLSNFAVTIDTVLIGNPSNDPDLQTQGLFGRVTTTYEIGLTEVTNAQYAEFLNTVAATDPYGLYDTNMGFVAKGGIIRSGSTGSFTYAVKSAAAGQGPGGTAYTYGDKPVVYVSWYDAVRFANWLHNGQGSGSTETGAYMLLGGTPTPSNGDSITRSAGATWFLPTESEWYKAAYYDGNGGVYFDYPTGTDVVPNNNLPTADTGNSANFFQNDDEPLTEHDNTTGSLDYPYTDAGAYALSESPYGTFDQAGNAWEWNQTLIGAGLRGRRGGAWSSDSTMLAAANQNSFSAAFATDNIGFRVASIPQPDDFGGDFNGDGAVDAADYVIWRKNNGTSAEYNEWRANFGMTSPGGGSMNITAVPEPTSMLLLVSGLLALRFRRRKFRA